MLFRRFVPTIVIGALPLAAFLACTNSSSEERSTSAPTRTSAQRLTADQECTHSMASIQPIYSGTHIGGENGSVDLGNGEQAEITNSDGVFFDWSSTIPIDLLIVRGSPRLANAFHQEPPATSGTRLSPPRDPDDQDRQLPLTSVKFCFRDRSGAPPVETPSSSEPQACTHPALHRNDTWARTDAIVGRVEATDATKLGRFAPTNDTTTCTSSFPAPTVEAATTPFHYDAWTFQNTTGADTCVSISTLTEAQELNDFQVQVYRDSFDPQDPTVNYYAHQNNCRVCNLSIRLAANQKMFVVLSAVGSLAATSGMGYRLAVGGCGTGTPTDPDGGGGGGDAGGDSSGGGKSW